MEPEVQTDGDTWGWVHGDWVVLTAPERCLPALDHYEGFSPAGNSLYERVLITVLVDGTHRAAWTYIKTPEPRGRFLPHGVWPSGQRNAEEQEQ